MLLYNSIVFYCYICVNVIFYYNYLCNNNILNEINKFKSIT